MIKEMVQLVDKYKLDSIKVQANESHATIFVQRGIFTESFTMTRDLIFGEEEHYEYAKDRLMEIAEKDIRKREKVFLVSENSAMLLPSNPKQLEG